MEDNRLVTVIIIVFAAVVLTLGWARVLRSPTTAETVTQEADGRGAIIPQTVIPSSGVESGLDWTRAVAATPPPSQSQFAMPESDAPNTQDIPGIQRFPNSRLVESQQAEDSGFFNNVYVALTVPQQVQRFYDSQFSDWNQFADSQVVANGQGLWSTYGSPDGKLGVSIMALTPRSDLPPGTTSNPTIINIMFVDSEKVNPDYPLFQPPGQP